MEETVLKDYLAKRDSGTLKVDLYVYFEHARVNTPCFVSFVSNFVLTLFPFVFFLFSTGSRRE